MERPLKTSSLRKVAESNFDSGSINLIKANHGDTYKSEKVNFSEINGYWRMTAAVHRPIHGQKSILLNFEIESNLPNRSDYGQYTVSTQVFYFGISETISDIFLTKKMTFRTNPIEISGNDPVSFDVKMTLSCFSNPLDNYVDKNAVWKQIASNNISMLSDPTYSDFTFIVEGHEFKVHKNILAATSPVFAHLFKSRMQESINNKCVLNDIKPNIFNHMLRFIYGGILPDEIENVALRLYEAAHYYDINNLMDICMKSIQLNLSASNASTIFLWAEPYNLEDLKKDALKQLNIEENNISPEMITIMMKRKKSELLVLESLAKLPRST